MKSWEQPQIIREKGRYFFIRPNEDATTMERIEVTNDVHGWIDREKQMTALELAKACLMVATTGTHNPLGGEVRRAIVTIFGPEIDAQLQSEFNKPM